MSTAESEQTRYATVVTQVGSLVPDFVDKGILIFFGDNAPAELHDISVLHRPDIEVGGLAVGDVVILDDRTIPDPRGRSRRQRQPGQARPHRPEVQRGNHPAAGR